MMESLLAPIEPEPNEEISYDANIVDNFDENRPDNDRDVEERQHFYDIINTFKCYRQFNRRKVEKRIRFVANMSEKHQNLLRTYLKNLETVKISIDHNYEIFKLIIAEANNLFLNSPFGRTNSCDHLVVKPENELKISRIDSVLNQIVREWSSQGLSERDSCFLPIINAIEEYFPEKENRSQIRILVPGCGLGRLPFEIAKRGYSSQGNEFSLMMLLVANFILNKIKDIDLYRIYPWVTQFSHNFRTDHQTNPILFPDNNPSNLPKNVDFSMLAGSFVDVYNNSKNRETFDCVTTCFFLDTASNIIEYIETIHLILKLDGIWINFGPLLYHYAEGLEPSIEPSYEIVKEIIKSFNFEFLCEKTDINCFYTRNPNSMASFQYKSVFFVCKK
ncbi:Carnosine N-methyltransferase [Sarcoptes scabiei]|uniref:carnosine N-methyltransferase n=1 Tax=Sarcoptes scabiei TaxID=52283 RepID=A0A834R6Q9_SARSC|nr:Carnosine N-methyltransferase [Sarcoptes scabiei]